MQKLGAEIKCEKVDRETQETSELFPVVSRSWRFPLIHIGALTKSIAPRWVTKTQVLTKSTRSPSPELWFSNRVHQAFLEAPTISKSSPRTPKHWDRLGAVNYKSNKSAHFHLTSALS
jgi:hypothetical protein